MSNEKYIGKLILVELSFLSESGDVLEQSQIHGFVEKIDENGLMRIRRDDATIFTIPFDENTMSKASPGVYKERFSGKEIINPDYITSWFIYQ